MDSPCRLDKVRGAKSVLKRRTRQLVVVQRSYSGPGAIRLLVGKEGESCHLPRAPVLHKLGRSWRVDLGTGWDKERAP